MILLFLIVAVCSCNFSDEVRELKGGWKFVSESKHDKAIDGGDMHIPCEVLQYGDNDNFIIAKQKPTDDCFLGKDTSVYKDGRDKIYYWLIVKKQKLLLGPLDELEFIQARRKYEVPDELKLESVY